jgi:hypothetical protein
MLSFKIGLQRMENVAAEHSSFMRNWRNVAQQMTGWIINKNG